MFYSRSTVVVVEPEVPVLFLLHNSNLSMIKHFYLLTNIIIFIRSSSLEGSSLGLGTLIRERKKKNAACHVTKPKFFLPEDVSVCYEALTVETPSIINITSQTSSYQQP